MNDHIYGDGSPPGIWYINYVGRPLYRLGRKLNIPKIGSLAMACAPGAFIHTVPFLFYGNVAVDLFVFAISELIITGLIYSNHRTYERLS